MAIGICQYQQRSKLMEQMAIGICQYQQRSKLMEQLLKGRLVLMAISNLATLVILHKIPNK